MKFTLHVFHSTTLPATHAVCPASNNLRIVRFAFLFFLIFTRFRHVAVSRDSRDSHFTASIHSSSAPWHIIRLASFHSIITSYSALPLPILSVLCRLFVTIVNTGMEIPDTYFHDVGKCTVTFVIFKRCAAFRRITTSENVNYSHLNAPEKFTLISQRKVNVTSISRRATDKVAIFIRLLVFFFVFFFYIRRIIITRNKAKGNSHPKWLKKKGLSKIYPKKPKKQKRNKFNIHSEKFKEKVLRSRRSRRMASYNLLPV